MQNNMKHIVTIKNRENGWSVIHPTITEVCKTREGLKESLADWAKFNATIIDQTKEQITKLL